MVFDRVNRNSIYFYKFNFNKPTDDEIKKSREVNSDNDNNNNGNSCKEDIYGRGSKSYQSQLDDPILDQIKANTKLSAEKCLTNY